MIQITLWSSCKKELPNQLELNNGNEVVLISIDTDSMNKIFYNFGFSWFPTNEGDYIKYTANTDD